MADADIAITAGVGTKVDTRTVGSGADEHRQVVVIGDPSTAANVVSVDAANGMDVDVTRVIPGTTATSLGKAEDDGHTTGDVGVAVWGVRNDRSATAFTTTNLDYTPLSADIRGQQFVIPGLDLPVREFAATTYRTPGRAGTTGQKIFAIHNATGSAIKALITELDVTYFETVVKAVTVAPVIVRLWRFTAIPTNGSGLSARIVPADSADTAHNGSVTLWGDASADGTGSGTTLTVTLPADTVIYQTPAFRLITAVGNQDRRPIPLVAKGVVLNPLEGLCVFLNYTVATQNPTTDMWLVNCKWREYV